MSLRDRLSEVAVLRRWQQPRAAKQQRRRYGVAANPAVPTAGLNAVEVETLRTARAVTDFGIRFRSDSTRLILAKLIEQAPSDAVRVRIDLLRARLVLAQRILDRDLTDGLGVLHATLLQLPDAPLADRELAVSAAIEAGALEIAEQHLPYLDESSATTLLLRADLARARTPKATAAWTSILAPLFEQHGIAAPQLAAGPATLFDRLTAEPGTPIQDGPLVTVVMSTYQPSDSLLTSLRSVLASSWRQLEVLVVDDGSATIPATIEATISADSRVRLIRQAQNTGTYGARNRGLAEARGEFVAFQDDDDWSHPDRIACQVRHLQQHPQALANFVPWVRATEELTFSHTGRVPAARPAEIGIMLRREPVLDRVGFFDALRKNADQEFRRRIEAVTGHSVPLLDGPPLLFGRTRAGSLSNGEVGSSWTTVSRRISLDSALRWHRRLGRGPRPALSLRTADERITGDPYFAAEALRGLPLPDLETVVVANVYDATAAEQRRLLGLVAARPGQIGVLPVPSLDMLFGLGPQLPDWFDALLRSGTVVLADPAHLTEIKELEVWGEAVLAFTPSGVLALAQQSKVWNTRGVPPQCADALAALRSHFPKLIPLHP